MTDTISPPPRNACPIPDYILGKLLYFDGDSDDNCRWVVYDGDRKVRCATRKDAIAYIQERVLGKDEEAERLVLDARAHIQRALKLLDKAAATTARDSLLLARLSAKLRPFIVDMDNITLYKYGQKTQNTGMPPSAC